MDWKAYWRGWYGCSSAATKKLHDWNENSQTGGQPCSILPHMESVLWQMPYRAKLMSCFIHVMLFVSHANFLSILIGWNFWVTNQNARKNSILYIKMLYSIRAQVTLNLKHNTFAASNPIVPGVILRDWADFSFVQPEDGRRLPIRVPITFRRFLRPQRQVGDDPRRRLAWIL